MTMLLQQKLREEKELRRSTMDSRHEFILSTVAEIFDMKQDDAEEFMLEGDQVFLYTHLHYHLLLLLQQLKKFNNFFASNGSQVLIFFYKPPKRKAAGGEEATKAPAYNANGRRLWITDGTKDEYTGHCIFFLRFNLAKSITSINIHQVCQHRLAKAECDKQGRNYHEASEALASSLFLTNNTGVCMHSLNQKHYKL